jgi:hypothetical protein
MADYRMIFFNNLGAADRGEHRQAAGEVDRRRVGCAHFDASAISCCQRLTMPAIAAPRMGASQNSQSCAI